MNDIIKIANEIANSTNNQTNFTNIENLPKTEQQQKDEVVEMIYQKHLQAQEWGNKLNQELETSTHKHRNRAKRGVGAGSLQTVGKVMITEVGTKVISATGDEIIGRKELLNTNQNKLNTVGAVAAGTMAVAGCAGGAVTGVVVGTNVFPIIGNIIGGVVGTIIGCAAGGATGQIVGRSITKEMENNRKRKDVSTIENKLDENIVKFINHEQHLPIDNKTNFVANNITSL